jgi:hypothetical protein
MSEEHNVFSFLGEEVVPLEFPSPSRMDVLLDYFRVYVSTMERGLEEVSHRTRYTYDSTNDPMLATELEEHLFVQTRILTPTMRRSLIVAAYSILEKGIKDRCQCLQDLYGNPISVDDLAGHGIRKYRKYMDAIAAVDMATVDEWPSLLKYGTLRNRLVHNLGLVNPSNTELIKFIKDNPDLRIQDSEVVIEDTACRAFVDLIRSFFKELDSRLPPDCSDLEPHYGFRP